MSIQFDIKEDKEKNILFITDAEGNDVLRAPLLNKGTAFTKEERDLFGLGGLLPPRVLTLDQQVKKLYNRFMRFSKPLELCKSINGFDEEKQSVMKKDINIMLYNFLRELQDRNEILFYAFSYKYLEEVMPIIYTPTVGDAVQRFSRDSAKYRGVFLSPINIDDLESVFNHVRFMRPTLAVVTDNQGILGLGDQGVGGIDIPIGKLALYVLGAGVKPWETLPITLDVGTNNPDDLKDPEYLGYKTKRLTDAEYDEFIEKFIIGLKSKIPNILLQWEDFSKQNAFTLLDKFRYKILSFNDDIQGTGSVVLAGTLNALKYSDKELKDQKFVVYGAGAGGIGIARQIVNCLVQKYGLTKEQAVDKIATIDSKGLITDQREVEDYKKLFSKEKNKYKSWDVEDISNIKLSEVIDNFKPTVLYGTSGCTGHFTKKILKKMTENTKDPIIFPLSNPNSKSEATPQEIYKFTNGNAIVATGSPFEPFQFNGKKIIIGQGNNFFIFPGVGFGAIISQAKYLSDMIFTEAAYTLSNCTSEDLISKGVVFPSVKDIRNISGQIALVTANLIAKEQYSEEFDIKKINSMMWKTKYHPLIKIEWKNRKFF